MVMVMKIEREIITKLAGWTKQPDRKPLIVQGARQVGKTWAIREFGKRNFEFVAEFNFEKTKELADLFKRTKDVNRVLTQLSMFTNVPIDPERTLIFFDEIQECNEALNTLKYFREDAPEYAVIAAGSLLGVTLSRGGSFPVGKVDFLSLYPVSFREYLHTVDKKMFDFVEALERVEKLPSIIFNRLTEIYRNYLVCGGMPEVAVKSINRCGSEEIDKTLTNILNAYTLDFAKHVAPLDIPRIIDVWNSVPSQLSRENKKFVYRLVKEGARARAYENAIEWLRLAGLIYKIYNVTNPVLPLKAYDDLSAFKIYLVDIGLLRRLAGLPADTFFVEPRNFKELKGALAENFVLQSLVNQFNELPRYWTSSGTAEVDFIIQHGTGVIPIEVKSGSRLSGKSLSVYNKKYHPDLRVRLSLNNLSLDGNLLNVPLFLADWLKRIIGNLE